MVRSAGGLTSSGDRPGGGSGSTCSSIRRGPVATGGSLTGTAGGASSATPARGGTVSAANSGAKDKPDSAAGSDTTDACSGAASKAVPEIDSAGAGVGSGAASKMGSGVGSGVAGVGSGVASSMGSEIGSGVSSSASAGDSSVGISGIGSDGPPSTFSAGASSRGSGEDCAEICSAGSGEGCKGRSSKGSGAAARIPSRGGPAKATPAENAAKSCWWLLLAPSSSAPIGRTSSEATRDGVTSASEKVDLDAAGFAEGGEFGNHSNQVVGGKGLFDNPVSPRLRAPRLIVWLQVAGHKQHGHMVKICRGLYIITNLVAIFAWHGHVGKHEDRLQFGQFLDRSDTVRDGFDLEALALQNPLGSLLNSRAIVCDQDQPSHTASRQCCHASGVDKRISRQTDEVKAQGIVRLQLAFKVRKNSPTESAGVVICEQNLIRESQRRANQMGLIIFFKKWNRLFFFAGVAVPDSPWEPGFALFSPAFELLSLLEEFTLFS